MVIRKIMLVNKQNGTFCVFGATQSNLNLCPLKANYANWWFVLIIKSTSYHAKDDVISRVVNVFKPPDKYLVSRMIFKEKSAMVFVQTLYSKNT